MCVFHSTSALKKYQSCGSIITTGEGYIQTPNYPGKYPRNSDCTWTLVAPSGMGWKIEFEDINNADTFNDGSISW